MPDYLVYKVTSFTGTMSSQDDVPERLEYAGATHAVNGDHAVTILGVKRPVLVLRMNTVAQYALKR